MNDSDRKDLADALATLRIARSSLVTAHARLDQAADGIEALLDADEPDRDDTDDDRSDEQSFTLTCDDCGHDFDPHDATHSIVGPHTAFYSCPNCSNTIRGPEPYLRDRDTNQNDDETEDE